MRLALATGASGLALAVWGFVLDGTPAPSQASLFWTLAVASLSGTAIGLALVWRRARGRAGRLLLAGAAVLAWRLAFFPIMVFSGHVAAIAELVQVHAPPLGVVVWPVFLVSAFALHAVAAAAASFLVLPFHPAVTAGLAGAFTVAALVSCTTTADLTLLPDTSWSLDAPVPRPSAPLGNPYLPALGEAGYSLPQRTLLLAAGLTYALVPESPWAAGVKGTLEEAFRRHPHASSADRVAEHYLAYRAAHARIGCRTLEACPEPEAGPPPPLPASGLPSP